MEMTFNMHLFIFCMLHILYRCGLGKGEQNSDMSMVFISVMDICHY